MTRTTETATREPDVFDEVGEFFTTLLATPPDRLTNCRGWTAHDLVAHLAAGAGEEADLIETHLAGKPERTTLPHDEREAPYRALPETELRERLVANGARLTTALHTLAGDEAGAVLFTGRHMSAADFAMHSRSECAIHRWDLVGSDDIGWTMLARPALTAHALTVLTSMSTLPEAPVNRLGAHPEHATTRLVLRSDPQEDVVVTVTGGSVSMTMEPPSANAPDVELEPAARLLLLWGRREPSAPIDLHAAGERRMLLNSLFGW